MHHSMTAVTSASLMLGLASATPVAATQFTFGTGEPTYRMEAAWSDLTNLTGWSTTHNSQAWLEYLVTLLSASLPNDAEILEIQFPLQADEFENGLGNDWQP
jgi:hypothetical protein